MRDTFKKKNKGKYSDASNTWLTELNRVIKRVFKCSFDWRRTDHRVDAKKSHTIIEIKQNKLNFII